MTVLRTDHNQQFDASGALIAEQVVDIDVTAEAVEYDLHTRIRQALTVNDTFLAKTSPTQADVLAQVRALTREASALIRLMVRQLDDTAGT